MLLDEKLAIAKQFILHSPPGQAQKVVQDVITLLREDGIEAKSLDEMLMHVNKEHFLPITVPGSNTGVLLTATGQLGGDTGLTFLDPEGKHALVIAHAEQRCTGFLPVEAPIRAACDAAEPHRTEVHQAMKQYVDNYLPGAIVTTYGFKENGILKVYGTLKPIEEYLGSFHCLLELRMAGKEWKVACVFGELSHSCRPHPSQVTCCVSRCNKNLSNYWSGLWRSSWTVEMAEGASSVRLIGAIHAFVHYFEDGNVQLDDTVSFDDTIEVATGLPSIFVKNVRELESGFMSAMETVYTTMSESVLHGLRRRLPITKVKFDWENKAAVHKLATDLTGTKLGN